MCCKVEFLVRVWLEVSTRKIIHWQNNWGQHCILWRNALADTTWVGLPQTVALDLVRFMRHSSNLILLSWNSWLSSVVASKCIDDILPCQCQHNQQTSGYKRASQRRLAGLKFQCGIGSQGIFESIDQRQHLQAREATNSNIDFLYLVLIDAGSNGRIHIRNPIMDGIKLNCHYLNIIMILCRQIVYYSYISMVRGTISVYTIPLMTANQPLLLLLYIYHGLPVN